MSETPDTVHGRLLESVHLSGYTFERACAELEWLLDEDRWKRVASGFEDINVFLATVDFSQFKIALEQRKKLAKRLQEIKAGQRATARLLGVAEQTVARDLGKSRGAPSGALPISTDQISKTKHANGNDTAPDGAWFQADIDPAADAKRDMQRQAKEQQRETRRETNREKVQAASDPLLSGAKFATIVIDPPWDWSDEGDEDQLGRARPTYATMAYEEIRKHPVDRLADIDCHCYLWVTNRSLPKGFALLETWGFRYVTCLTWCKPSIGMGNYFRGSTEQVLFGIKGSQPLKRHDVGTWFRASRNGPHSTKPDVFYELVEGCSPSPYIDIFARKPRPGWSVWGADAV